MTNENTQDQRLATADETTPADGGAAVRCIRWFAGVSYEKDGAKRRMADMSGEWIPVTERLPEEGVDVLWFSLCKDMKVGRRYGEEIDAYAEDGFEWMSNFSHWMPLPAPPTNAKQPANTRDQQPRTKEAAHMSETNERSVASAGSVAGAVRNGAPSGCETVRSEPVPVAWAVMVGGERMYVSWCKEMCEDEAYYHRHPCGDSVSVVPLYRQPQDGVVRLPPLDPNGAPGWNAAIGAVRVALAEAGVDWDTE